jgi:hypothetical protein
VKVASLTGPGGKHTKGVHGDVTRSRHVGNVDLGCRIEAVMKLIREAQ